MLNSIKKTTSKYTRLLIRMDDISENMNWKYMDKCETLFDKFNLRPLLGVIPENKDPELLKYPKNSNFWKRVESWKKKDGRYQCMDIRIYMKGRPIRRIFLIMVGAQSFLV